MAKSYSIYNFPVSYIPGIIDDARSALRSGVIDFALIYATQDDNATAKVIEDMSKKFGISLGDKNRTCRSARSLMAKYRDSPEPLTYLHHNLLWKYVDGCYFEKDVMALALLLALRSIGKPGIANKTNIAMIAARMSGRAVSDGSFHKDVLRWTTRRKLDSLKSYLQSLKVAYFPQGHSRGVTFWLTQPPGGK